MNRNLPWICLGLGALKFVPNAKVKLVGNSQGNPPEHGIPNLKLPMTFHFMLKKLWIESPSHCCCSFLLALSMLYIRSWLHLIAVVQGNHIHGLIRTYYPSTCKCSDQIKIIHHLWKARKKTWIKIHPSLIFHLGGGDCHSRDSTIRPHILRDGCAWNTTKRLWSRKAREENILHYVMTKSEVIPRFIYEKNIWWPGSCVSCQPLLAWIKCIPSAYIYIYKSYIM